MLGSRLAVVITLLTASSSLTYELMLAKALSNLGGQPLLWESLAIGIFLAGMGIGAFTTTNVTAPLARLLRLELALTGLGAVTLPCIYLMHIVYRIYFYQNGILPDFYYTLDPLYVFCILGLIFSLGLGFLCGQELPLLLAASPKPNRTLAFYYFGALAASLALAYSPAKALDPSFVMLLAAGSSFTACLLLLARLGSGPPLPQYLAVVFACSLVYTTLEPLESLRLKNFYFNKIGWEQDPEGPVKMLWPTGPLGLYDFFHSTPQIERTQSAYQTIDIVPNFQAGKDVPGFSMHLDHHFQVGSETSYRYHEAMAFVPMMATRFLPRRVLILGGGDGVLARELLRLPQLESITLVELDAEVLKLGRTKFSSVNESALSSDKVRVINADALVYLRENKERFDAAYLDFTYPFGFDSSRLYTYELYQLVRARLTESGYLVATSPDSLRDQANELLSKITFNTLRRAGLAQVLTFDHDHHSFVIGREKHQDWHEGYIDLGLKFNRLSRLEPHKISELSKPVDWRFVHSMLRPIGVLRKDPFL